MIIALFSGKNRDFRRWLQAAPKPAKVVRMKLPKKKKSRPESGLRKSTNPSIAKP